MATRSAMLRSTPELAACLLAAGLGGCGTDVAQTAYTVKTQAPAGLDCSPPAVPPVLPSDPALGGDAKQTSWVLQAGDYGADQGPGVVVAARDGFRLFVNERLLATGEASLAPVFVPLTLVPGANAVSVVVTASSGPPALLAVVDELERPYPSDASWKVSVAPTGDWSAAGYDDSAWSNATDHGTPEENPGCDPGPGFPMGSGAAWVSAPATGTAVFRRTIRIAPVGFGAATTGGGSAEPVLFDTDVPEDELPDAVEALAAVLEADGPAVIVLGEGSIDLRRKGDDVTDTTACPTPCPDDAARSTKNLLPDDETCAVAEVPVERTERQLDVASNKTIVGLGRGAQLFGATLDIGNSKNVIVRNVALYGVNPDLIEAGDGISLDGADGIWIDHVTFESISDGFVDATTGSQNVTLSWLKNNGHNELACLGRHPRSNELADTTATIHHTLWQQVSGRAPLATREGSRVHLFNDVVDDDVTYAVGAGCGAQILLEASSFTNVATPTAKLDTLDCSDASPPGLIRAEGLGNSYGTGVPSTEPNDTVFSPSYEYKASLDSAETASALVRKRAGTGSRWALPLDYP